MCILLQIKAWLIWPITLSIVIACILAAFKSLIVAKSFFVGALVVIIPHAIFGYYCFRYKGSQNSRKIWKNFARGEAIKILLSGLLCALVLCNLSIAPFWFILAIILTQFIQLVINTWLLSC